VNTVSVIDATAGSVSTTINVGVDPVGVAVSPRCARHYPHSRTALELESEGDVHEDPVRDLEKRTCSGVGRVSDEDVGFVVDVDVGDGERSQLVDAPVGHLPRASAPKTRATDRWRFGRYR
jgi:hypothetical protein